jgi:hypothetical protein
VRRRAIDANALMAAEGLSRPGRVPTVTRWDHGSWKAVVPARAGRWFFRAMRYPRGLEKLKSSPAGWRWTPDVLMTCAHPIARYDPYLRIHKGLRVAMFDAIHRIGRMDVADAGEMQAALDQAHSLLALMAVHIKSQQEYMSAAIEARCPGGAQGTARDHDEHLDRIATLHAQIAELRGAAPSARPEFAYRLYLELTELTAKSLARMRVDETQNRELLWSLYGDHEVIAIHDRLLASIEPHVLMEAIGWMARGLSLPELVGLLTEVRHKMPRSVLGTALAQVRRQLDPAAWERLSQSLGALDGTGQPLPTLTTTLP